MICLIEINGQTMNQLHQQWRQRGRHWLSQVLDPHAGADAQWSRLMPLAVLGSLAMPLYYWIWHACFHQRFESPLLRGLGMLVCLTAPLALRLPQRWRRLYLWSGLMYMLPFFFTYMFLMNGGSLVWSESLLIALVVLFHFDTRVAALLYVAGTSLACAAYAASADAATAQLLSPAVLQQLPIHWFAIVALSLAKMRRDVLAYEKLSGMGAGLASVAHELRTPLVALDANARGLSRMINALGGTSVHSSAADSGAAQSALQRMQFEVRHMHHLIDLFLLSATAVKQNLRPTETLGMAALVEAALRRYPYDTPSEQQAVRCDVRADFRFAGQSDLAVVILLNLLRNALQAIRRAGKGRVRIVVDGGHRPPRLLFIDTGSGIAAHRLARIFERFYSYPAHTGSGIGLALCRDIVRAWSGAIRCQSREHGYTIFTLEFPPLAQAAPLNPPPLSQAMAGREPGPHSGADASRRASA